jgi:hypothetical protein
MGPVRPGVLKGKRDEGLAAIAAAGRGGRLRRAGTRHGGGGGLGNGTTADPAGPVQVTGLANATQVAAGGRFSLAVHTVLGLLGS